MKPPVELTMAEATLTANEHRAQVNAVAFGAMLKVMELAGIQRGRTLDVRRSVLKLGKALRLMMPDHECNSAAVSEAVAVGFVTLGELFEYLPKNEQP